ncbi:tail fiber assembly protein [Pseudomonas sp. dw_358]|uniref:tail fiber assembly protein n=1 Tax=Pseudomonas sp. dw_358 TaxID=2720083 RepID=UPI001BD6D016|nr:tail fiber assembly protein [Pseudomonas sp. dw_358]
MTTYAIISDDIVIQIFEADGDITDMFAAGFATFVALTTAQIGVVQQRWTYDATTGVLSAPVDPVPTAAEILATNTNMRDSLLGTATLAIAPLQDAVDLDDATTDETALLKLWKQYRVAVNRIDLTVASPTWPTQPA